MRPHRKGLPLFTIIAELGWPIWPLILASILALALIIERGDRAAAQECRPGHSAERRARSLEETEDHARRLRKLEANSPLGQGAGGGVAQRTHQSRRRHAADRGGRRRGRQPADQEPDAAGFDRLDRTAAGLVRHRRRHDRTFSRRSRPGRTRRSSRVAFRSRFTARRSASSLRCPPCSRIATSGGWSTTIWSTWRSRPNGCSKRVRRCEARTRGAQLMRFRRALDEEPEINLIPLIDVLLIVLIFLAVSTTYSRFAELQITSAVGRRDAAHCRRTKSTSRSPRMAATRSSAQCWHPTTSEPCRRPRVAGKGARYGAADHQCRRPGATPGGYRRDGSGAPGRHRAHQFCDATHRRPASKRRSSLLRLDRRAAAHPATARLAEAGSDAALSHGCCPRFGASLPDLPLPRALYAAGHSPSQRDSMCRSSSSATSTSAGPARRRSPSSWSARCRRAAGGRHRVARLRRRPQRRRDWSNPDDAAREVGDEPLLIVRATRRRWRSRSGAPRPRELLRAAHPECDLIVADDGLQHLQLARDLEIAVA